MGKFCKNCGAQIKDNSKFCPDCGERIDYTPTTCPHCGANIDDNTIFCPECGTNIGAKNNRKLCPNCGELIEDGEKFCENCGARLNTPQKTVKKGFVQQYKMPLLVLGIVAVIILACAFALSMNENNNQDYATQTIKVGGISFEIPDDYYLVPSDDNTDYNDLDYLNLYTKSYSNDDDIISIDVMYSSSANIDADEVVEEIGGGPSETLMGQDGILIEHDSGYIFNCGIDNKVVMVSTNNKNVYDRITILEN